MGRIIADVISLDLFLSNYVLFRGSAMEYNGKKIAIISPSFNGKTTFVKSVLLKGGKYITEDVLIFSPRTLKTFIACPKNMHPHPFLRRILEEGRPKTMLSEILHPGSICDEKKLELDEIFLTYNSYKPTKICFTDFFMRLSLLFMTNYFVRSLIFGENLSESVLSKIDKIRKTKFKHKIVAIHDFDYLSLLEK
jgi:hypothetical protein